MSFWDGLFSGAYLGGVYCMFERHFFDDLKDDNQLGFVGLGQAGECKVGLPAG